MSEAQELRDTIVEMQTDLDELDGITAKLTAENGALRTELDRLRDAVKLAHERFTSYALTHRAKGTADGDAKAAENLRLADVMKKALES